MNILPHIKSNMISNKVYIPQMIKRIDCPLDQLGQAKIPPIQRGIDSNHVEQMYDLQVACYDTNKCYYYPNSIAIAINTITKKECIVDGQHRLEVFSKLQRNYPSRDIKLTVDYYQYSTEQELDHIFLLVNTYKSNNIVELGIDNYKILNEFKKYIKNTFPSYLKTSSKPHKPSFNLETLCGQITQRDIIQKLQIKTGSELIDWIEKLNKFYGNVSSDQFILWGLKDAVNHLDKMKDYNNKCYLGLYGYGSGSDYRYEWLDRIVDSYESNTPFSEMPHYADGIRKFIPKQLRNLVWEAYNGKNTDGQCYCCEKIITSFDFECGHNIPVTRGGKTVLSNMRPVCSICNADMGQVIMDVYKEMMNKDK